MASRTSGRCTRVRAWLRCCWASRRRWAARWRSSRWACWTGAQRRCSSASSGRTARQATRRSTAPLVFGLSLASCRAAASQAHCASCWLSRWACAQLGLATWLCALGAVELALTHPAVYKVRPHHALWFLLPCLRHRAPQRLLEGSHARYARLKSRQHPSPAERSVRALRQGLASSAWQLAVLALAGAAPAAAWLPAQRSSLSTGSYARA